MKTIRIGMIGCGIVGQGVWRIVQEHAEDIEARLGARVEIVSIFTRTPQKTRQVAIPHRLFVSTMDKILSDSSIDIVVEVMGGLDPAAAYIRAALEAGKSVVTANKALLAERGYDLYELAESRGVDLCFEAAVAGGVPVIRVLREALASDRVLSLRGIVNGTSNYILTRMLDEGLDFKVALKQAQDAGYAEADPALDISGGDAAHKLAILAMLAFGARVQTSQVHAEGIDAVDAIDMHFASRFGYVIKPLAVAKLANETQIELRVHPALVERRSMLASISNALNAVYIEGAMLGPCLLSGYGAGSLPTATSVVSDVIEASRNILRNAKGRVPPCAVRCENLKTHQVRDPGECESRYYLRFSVLDRPGVLAKIAGILGSFGVSIEQMVQEGRAEVDDLPVPMVMLTHRALNKNIRAALSEIQSLPAIVEPPRALRIEDT